MEISPYPILPCCILPHWNVSFLTILYCIELYCITFHRLLPNCTLLHHLGHTITYLLHPNISFCIASKYIMSYCIPLNHISVWLYLTESTFIQTYLCRAVSYLTISYSTKPFVLYIMLFRVMSYCVKTESCASHSITYYSLYISTTSQNVITLQGKIFEVHALLSSANFNTLVFFLSSKVCFVRIGKVQPFLRHFNVKSHFLITSQTLWSIINTLLKHTISVDVL